MDLKVVTVLFIVLQCSHQNAIRNRSFSQEQTDIIKDTNIQADKFERATQAYRARIMKTRQDSLVSCDRSAAKLLIKKMEIDRQVNQILQKSPKHQMTKTQRCVAQYDKEAASIDVENIVRCVRGQFLPAMREYVAMKHDVEKLRTIPRECVSKNRERSARKLDACAEDTYKTIGNDILDRQANLDMDLMASRQQVEECRKKAEQDKTRSLTNYLLKFNKCIQ